MQILIGCGSRRDRLFTPDGKSEWTDLKTLDRNADHKPDIVWDLENVPYPFEDNSCDEVHAIEVLEHIGDQGDFRTFFSQFSEFWRILKPGGFLCASCPSLTSRWLWGDPSHRRVIAPESLTFLIQPQYTRQVGTTPMSDFRDVYKADFDLVYSDDDEQNFRFILMAVKPSRIT